MRESRSGDGGAHSALLGLVPALARVHLYRERNRKLRGVLHALPENLRSLLRFFYRRFDDQFVVHL